MNRIKSVLPELLILIIAGILCLCAWPLGILGHGTYESFSTEKGVTLSAPLSEGVVFEGSFAPQYANLDSIGIRFNTRTDVNVADGVLHFELVDSSGDSVYSSTVNCVDIKNNDYEVFELTQPLSVGEVYSYVLSTSGCTDGAPRLYLGSTGVGPLEQQSLSMNGNPVGKWAILQLTYTARLTLRKALVYDISILLIAMAVLFMLRGFHSTPSFGLFKSFRRFCIYLCFVLIGCMTILLFDESSKSLTTPGNELKREFGQPAYDYTSVNEDSGESGAWLTTDRYALNRGIYSISVEYTAAAPGSTLSLIDNGKTISETELPVTETYLIVPFTLDKDCQDLQIWINYGGSGLMTVYSVSLNPVTRFYNDTYYYVVVFLLLNIFMLCSIAYEKRHPMDGKSKAAALLLLGIGLFSFLPYANGVLPWADDLCYHLIRIEGIKDGLRDGQFPVYIYPEGLQGYGYLNCMYPNLFLYLPAFLRLLGVSIAASYKTLVLLFHLATAFLTYYSMKSIYPRQKPALAAALLYCLCTYRYVNFYARGAVGEALAMTFFPLLIAGLYHVLVGEKKKWWLLAVGLSGLLQTHILSATLGAFLCVIAGIVFFSQVVKEKRFLPILKAAGAFLLWNLWFLVPFLYYYKNANFRLSALDYSNYSEYSLLLSDLAGTINLDSNRTLTLGLPVVLCAGIALFYLIARHVQPLSGKETHTAIVSPTFLNFLLVMGLVFTLLLLGQFNAKAFMELPVFDWFFKKIQFPWRLLGPASLCFIMAGCISLEESKLLQKHAGAIFAGLALVSMLPFTLYHEEQFMYATYTASTSVGHESKLIGIPKGENTIVYPYEWRRDGMGDDLLVPEYVRTTDSSGTTVSDFSREGTTSSITYSTTVEDCLIEFPVQYYSGYKAYDENGKKVEIAPTSNQLVGFYGAADGAAHTITLSFHQNTLFILGELLSFLSIIGAVLYLPTGQFPHRFTKRKK